MFSIFGRSNQNYDGSYRRDFQPRYQYNQQPFLNDLFFGAKVSEAMSSGYKKASKIVGSLWKNYMKGVSPGGEEFIVKFEKLLKNQKHPLFMVGTMKQVVQSFDQSKKPLLLYLSGDDNTSRLFEMKILTKDGIIMLMDDNFQCLGLKSTSNEGILVKRGLDPNQRIPCVLIMNINKQENKIDIRFMLEGESLVENDGETYFEFLS